MADLDRLAVTLSEAANSMLHIQRAAPQSAQAQPVSIVELPEPRLIRWVFTVERDDNGNIVRMFGDPIPLE